MNKEELAAAVAVELGVSVAEATRMITAVFAQIQKELAGGGHVTIKGFGSFSVVERAARAGRDLQANQKLTIAPKLAPKFQAGKTLKEAISAGK